MAAKSYPRSDRSSNGSAQVSSRKSPSQSGAQVALRSVGELRISPHNIEAEQAVLGALLIDNSVIPAVVAFLNAFDFYRDAHELIYTAIVDLTNRKEPADEITVANELRRRGKLDHVGGRSYVMELAAGVASAASASYHAQIVKQASLKRAFIEIGDELQRQAFDPSVTAEHVWSRLEELRGQIQARAIYRGAVTVPFDEIEERELRWFWQYRIPLGCLSTFAGIGGLGKSTVAIDLAARTTRGESLPSTPDVPNPAGSVLLLSCEDAADTVVKKRLRLAGANMSRVRMLNPDVMATFTLADIATLDRAIAEAPDTRMVVIDPPTALTGGIDDHKNAPLRALLAPLAEFARRHDVAVILVTHVAKQTSTRAADRIIGSVAWTNAVRAAWMFSRDPEDKSRCRFLPVKNNLAPFTRGLAYRIGPDEPRVTWEEELDLDADDAARAEVQADREHGRPRGPAPAKSDAFAEWLLERLADGHPIPVKQLVDDARADGLLKAPTAAESKASISSLYAARDRVPAMKPGAIVEQLEAPVGHSGRMVKHWQLAGKDPAIATGTPF